MDSSLHVSRALTRMLLDFESWSELKLRLKMEPAGPLGF
jgi:hypothetical protein